MNTEVFETPQLEESFEPYAPANASARHTHAAASVGLNPESVVYDKGSMELNEQEITASKAFEVFMGKVYKPSFPKQTEYESASVDTRAKSTLESPLARFSRLSLELKELEADLTQLAADAELKKNKVMVDAGQEAELDEVMQGINTLQLSLLALEKNAAFQPFLRADLRASSAEAALSLQKDLTTRFFEQIEALKRQQQGQTHSSSNDTPIVYEIYSNGELNAVDRDTKARIGALEARISTLERTIGSFRGLELRIDGLSSLSGVSRTDLTSVVTELEQRVALMSEKNLDAVKARTTALIHEFTLLSKLKQTPSVQGALNVHAEREQIQKVYDQLNSLDAVVATIPTVVDRLVSLKSVHDEALEVSTRVNKIEQTQNSLTALLDSDAELLTKMEASLADNVQTFQANIQELDARMTKLLALSSDR